jgi:hypothetical protein
MLTPNIQPNIGTNPKQIAIRSPVPSAVVYIVPAGRKFIGNFSATGPNGALINGSQVIITEGIDVELLAETVVANLATNSIVQLIGIEVDA